MQMFMLVNWTVKKWTMFVEKNFIMFDMSRDLNLWFNMKF